MDVLLKTNDPERYLGLLQISRVADTSGFCYELVVRSHDFAVSMQLCFEPAVLIAFHDELARIYRTLIEKKRGQLRRSAQSFRQKR